MAIMAMRVVLYSWVIISIFPLYWIMLTSVKTESDITGAPHYVPFIDFTPTFDSWIFILSDHSESLVTRFLYSLAVSTASTLLVLLFGSLAVYGLTRFRFLLPAIAIRFLVFGLAIVIGVATVTAVVLRILFAVVLVMLLMAAARLYSRNPPRVLGLNNNGIMFAILATRILPPVVVVLPIYLAAHWANALDTIFVLVIVYTASNLPVAAWLLQPVFGQIRTDQEEAAQLDGASSLRIFFSIVLPMVAPGIAAAGLLIFVLCWNEYLFAAYLTGGHAMALPPWMVGQMSVKEAQIGGEAEEWAHLSAATVFMVLPLLALTGFVQRALIGNSLWWRVDHD
jgi:multiple sugar transport system permease protein